MKIVFMGTPDFAVSSLDALVREGFDIAAVVTAPDKPSGRGMKVSQSAVKQYAIEKKLNIIQPVRLKDPEFVQALKHINADIHIVVAFRMLPEVVWSMPPQGTVNLHASYLPAYRGAAPINWAIINGEKETGVSTFRLKQEIDTGNVLLREKILIGDNETAGELHDRMKTAGASLLVKTIRGIADQSLQDIPQSELNDDVSVIEKHAPKIFSETCRIEWNRPVDEVYNLIRGLSPYPAAFTELNNKMFKIYRAEKEYGKPFTEPGTYSTDHKTYLKFSCKDGFISCREIQLEGKKKINIEDFLRGYRFQ